MSTTIDLERLQVERQTALPYALFRSIRPQQWPKNLLVFGAPAAAGLLMSTRVLLVASLAFAAFTLAASGTYLINDAIDAPTDRLHPTKRHRPVAAGVISRGVAVSIGVALIVFSLVPALAIGRGAFFATLLAYIGLTVLYSVWLKQVVVVDLVAVASGFGLRAVGGAFAIAVPISQWFLMVSFFGALFIVAGKRFGEHQRLGSDAGAHRNTLDEYAEFYTQHVMTLSSGITLTGYGLWGYQHGHLDDAWFLMSFVLLITTLLRFALRVHTGASDDPVEIVWRDRPLRALAVLWMVFVVTGIHLT